MKPTRIKHVKTGDMVKILAGKDKGKVGKVIQVFPTQQKVVVEGVNMMKKHVRARNAQDKGQVIELSAPLHASNVKKTDEKPEPKKKTSKKVVQQTDEQKA